MTRFNNLIFSRRKQVLLVALLLVIGGVIYFFLNPREPNYQGKPLSAWIRGLEYENVNPTPEQQAALRAMGEPAVSGLINLLERHDSAWKAAFVQYARKHAGFHNY